MRQNRSDNGYTELPTSSAPPSADSSFADTVYADSPVTARNSRIMQNGGAHQRTASLAGSFGRGHARQRSASARQSVHLDMNGSTLPPSPVLHNTAGHLPAILSSPTSDTSEKSTARLKEEVGWRMHDELDTRPRKTSIWATLITPRRLGIAMGSLVFLLVLVVSSGKLHQSKTLPIGQETQLSAAEIDAALTEQRALAEFDTDPLAFRKHLDSQHGPVSYADKELQDGHSPLLTFQSIYIVQTPCDDARLVASRRRQSQKLADALGLSVRFAPALSPSSPLVAWIADRVSRKRQVKGTLLMQSRGVEGRKIGGLQVGSPWLSPSVKLDRTEAKLLHSYLRGYPVQWQEGRSTEAVLSDRDAMLRHKPTVDEAIYSQAGSNWVQYLLTRTRLSSNGTVELEGDFEITRQALDDPETLLRDPLESNRLLQLTADDIALWYTHSQLLRQLKDDEAASVLILADTVDAEFDLETRWLNIWRRLPTGRNSSKGQRAWDITYLGHTWGRESLRGGYYNPLLHRSNEPRSLIAYALSREGIAHLTSAIEDPWSAYQTKLDIAIATLIRAGALNSFSVEPPIVVEAAPEPLLQSATPAERQALQVERNTRKWRGSLHDSTLERVWLDENRVLPEHEESDLLMDLSTGLGSTIYRVKQWVAEHERNISIARAADA
ncbi:uncharacterized protein L969DRAFT_79330 [Mixia osmundae IAM 14324]|uniref:Uncharacterized protein n=1 Tax=Mixia osmundae (strain CBS 9802 / IAM 14324 / JCM 22182 / KY 12970) TaxID=764103 RepID=G7E2G5_MIXOS|nr:uncharacterized protein L969DRAFT_79330 [Mixia osmundae IAM 14324]KEI36896.1 hypothetical protein L969DRAFT_79330 [Mixia osmundae IAM 14324]GAA97025.1 hypothetical protein E5Q_03700 [Mixia osmundae IAM 14324]